MEDTAVAFYGLSFVDEGDDVVVGRPDNDTYVILPAEGAALLGQLVNGMPLRSAADWYEETYGEAVDIDEFLETLVELGFVRDGHEDPPAPAANRAAAGSVSRPCS